MTDDGFGEDGRIRYRRDHVIVYLWVQRFTPLLIDAARACRPVPGDRWFAESGRQNEQRAVARVMRADRRPRRQEVGLATAPLLDQALSKATAAPAARWVVVNLTKVDFFGAVGLTVLLTATHHGYATGVPVVVVTHSGQPAHRTIPITELGTARADTSNRQQCPIRSRLIAHTPRLRTHATPTASSPGE